MSHYQTIAEAINYVHENFKQQPSLKDVANHVCMSEFHLQRVFQEWAGITPKKFLQFLNLNYAKKLLTSQETLFDTAHQTGLSGTGRLHDLFVQIEAMTPAEYKHLGKNLTISYQTYQSGFGSFLVASTSKGVCYVAFYDNESQALADLRAHWQNASIEQKDSIFHEQVNQFLNGITDHKNPIHLHLRGTDFQIKVWEALLKIPEGTMVNYSDISAAIARPTAQRAIGTAIGDNPIAYLIPCHRVIKKTGIIGDYRWGTVRKTALLASENCKSL